MAPRRPIVAVVDDDLRVLESLEDLLESAGHSVRLFSSSGSLLEDDNLSEIDCLVSDVAMPVIDGFKLRGLVQEARPELPVILITGRHEIADQQREIGLGYQRFFRKPFDGQDLLAAIAQALRIGPGDA